MVSAGTTVHACEQTYIRLQNKISKEIEKKEGKYRKMKRGYGCKRFTPSNPLPLLENE